MRFLDAAHEQIAISGNPNIFGFLVAEDALDCSSVVDGQGHLYGDAGSHLWAFERR